VKRFDGLSSFSLDVCIRGVMASSMRFGSMFAVSGSMSASTGFPLSCMSPLTRLLMFPTLCQRCPVESCEAVAVLGQSSSCCGNPQPPSRILTRGYSLWVSLLIRVKEPRVKKVFGICLAAKPG